MDYVLVGGGAGQAHGATRPTVDLDCVPKREADNLTRLAAALRELNARLRVAGLEDDEAAELPVILDATTLGRAELSTWRTDAGDLDILADIPDRRGRRLRYDDLVSRAQQLNLGGTIVQVADLEDIIASKEWANRPKDRDALPELRRLHAASRSSSAPNQPEG